MNIAKICHSLRKTFLGKTARHFAVVTYLNMHVQFCHPDSPAAKQGSASQKNSPEACLASLLAFSQLQCECFGSLLLKYKPQIPRRVLVFRVRGESASRARFRLKLGQVRKFLLMSPIESNLIQLAKYNTHFLYLQNENRRQSQLCVPDTRVHCLFQKLTTVARTV